MKYIQTPASESIVDEKLNSLEVLEVNIFVRCIVGMVGGMIWGVYGMVWTGIGRFGTVFGWSW